MKFRISLLLFIFLFTACAPGTPVQDPTLPPEATRTLPPPAEYVTRVPSAEGAVVAFLEAWQAENYEAMYEMLTPLSKDANEEESFTRRYTDVAVRTTLENLEFEILSTLTNPNTAQVAYRVTLHTKMLGDFTREMTMNLSLEQGSWRVQWDEGLILPELKGGNNLVLDIESPQRGNIYDRNGNGVAVASDIFAIGIVKTQMSSERESLLLSELSRLIGRHPEAIKALYDNNTTYVGDYIAVGEVRRDAVMSRYDVLAGLADVGLRLNPYNARLYFDGGIAPHVTGYVAAIQAGQEDRYLREGYRLDDRVGMSGLEWWGEEYLIGRRKASLHVVNPQGQVVSRLAQVESQPSQSVYLTIERNLQLEAQQAIASFNGAIVIIERDTGRVLALVSSPGFDPNAFEFQNINSSSLLSRMWGDGLNRLFNRASGNGYPLGSVFKIITMATALETGVYTPDSTYNCQHWYNELAGQPLKDWTLDKGLPPSGVLTLEEGLMRSCNPWFYHIGHELYRQGYTTAVSDMARAFGLGSRTGIQGVNEETGSMPNPGDETMAVQLAIGQGEMLVNPLQVARFVAAVGNGGTLYRPQVIEKITDPDGNASMSFAPDAQGELPLSPENLASIQQAMRWVVNSPRGTAVQAFSGMSIPIYGKTGTAESDYFGRPHSWFAGYTNANRADKPDIAFVVLAEYAGEGSEIAAPIARRILEVYFMGQLQKVYPWEARPNVTRTPTPSVTNTPPPPPAQPEAEATPESPEDGDDNDFNERTATPEPTE